MGRSLVMASSSHQEYTSRWTVEAAMPHDQVKCPRWQRLGNHLLLHRACSTGGTWRSGGHGGDLPVGTRGDGGQQWAIPAPRPLPKQGLPKAARPKAALRRPRRCPLAHFTLLQRPKLFLRYKPNPLVCLAISTSQHNSFLTQVQTLSTK